MSDLHIHRQHQLGLSKAREIALRWAEDAEAQFDMECTILEGETSDTVEFTRSGVRGQMIVAADHFELTATLGFLFKAFAGKFQDEVSRQLDAALAKHGKPPAKSARKPR